MVRWLLSGRTWIWTQVVSPRLYAFNYCLLFCLSLCVLFWFSAVEGYHLPVCYNSWAIFLCIMMVLALSVCKIVFSVLLTTLTKYWILGVDAEAYELAQLKKTNHPMYKGLYFLIYQTRALEVLFLRSFPGLEFWQKIYILFLLVVLKA